MQRNVKVLTLCSFTLGFSIVAGCASPASTGIGTVAPSAAGATRRSATSTVTLDTRTQPATRESRRGWLLPRARSGKQLVYVSDQYKDAVYIYPANESNPAPVGEITDGISTPDGLAVDAKGNLYVANAGGSTVTVYPPGKTDPSQSYSPGQNPVDVLVGSDGTVYIAQGILGCECIDEYAAGSTNPKLVIELDGTGGSPLFMALNSSNDLYVSLSNATVYEFAPGQTSGTNLGLAGLLNARGLGFDPKGDLVVANDQLMSDDMVNIYKPGQTAVKKQVIVGPQPFEVTFAGRGDKLMYVADVSYQYDGYVAILDAGHGWKSVGTISQDLEQPLGVALGPE
jgi:hypothetical protein